MMPDWLTIELALLPVVAGVLVYFIRQAAELAAIKTWRELHEKRCDSLEETLTASDAEIKEELKDIRDLLRPIARDLNQLLGRVGGGKIG